VIGGGSENKIAANSFFATIAGGSGNDIGTNSISSAIGGGSFNNIASNALYAVIPGGNSNAVGAAASYAFAAGRRAKANHQGAFVWADSTAADIASTANNQFVVRASGGMDLYSASTLASLTLRANYLSSPPSWPLSISQNLNSIMTISNGGMARITLLDSGRVGIGNVNPTQLLQVGNATCNGTTWNNASDRNLKDNIHTIDPREILEKVAALPVSRWNYKTQPGATHLGPMAQDFRAAFGLGEDDKHIATVDADGVALAAIQGLNQKMEHTQRENESLKERVEKLEKLLQKLANE
jgi:hypothetical protein